MKSTREIRRGKEEQTAHNRKMGKGDDAAKIQRAAFGDLTNAVQKNAANGKELGKKTKVPTEARLKPKVCAPKIRTAAVAVQPQKRTKKMITATATAAIPAASKAAGSLGKPAVVNPVKKEVTEDKAVEEPVVTSSQESAADAGLNRSTEMVLSDLELSMDTSRMSLDQSEFESCRANEKVMHEVPLLPGLEDIDTGDQDDIGMVAMYAYDIFQYYKNREKTFRLVPYMSEQPELNQHMRAVMVDWMVEMQENFELNHETLYLAIKLMDTYLAKVIPLPRSQLQLVGAVALFLASKFDERLPPAIDDILYVCDHAYIRIEFLELERTLFRTVGFDLGCPISYRFLRRYAKCARTETRTLYLARYLLEYSLMEYKFAFQKESMMAAAVLYMARRMRNEGGWTKTLEYYTGYKLRELKPLINEVNIQLHRVRFPELETIRAKYQHRVFLGVAHTPLMDTAQLFPAQESAKPSQLS